MISDDVLNSPEANAIADQVKSGKSQSLDTILNSPESDQIATEIKSKPENPARKTYKNLLSSIFESEFHIPKPLSEKVLSAMEKNPYGDANIQAGAENYLQLKRMAERPFSQSASNKTAKDLKDLEDEFNSRYADKGSVLGAKEVMKAIPYFFLPGGKARGVGNLAKTASFLGESAGFGSLYGAASANPDESLKKAAGIGAVVNPALGGIAHGIGSIAKAFIKKPDATLKNLETMKGQPIIGGEMMESPKTSEFQTGVLSNIPTSGQMTHFNKIINGMKKDASKAWDMISGGDDPEQAAENLLSDSKENRSQVMKKKGQLYDDADNLFEKEGMTLDMSPARTSGRDILSKYFPYVNEYPSAADSSFENSIKEIIDKGGLQEDFNKFTGEKTPTEDALKFAKFKAKNFDELSKNEDNDFKSMLYSRMAKGLRDAARFSSENSYNSNVRYAYALADKFYKNKVSPFEDNFVRNYLRNDKHTSEDFYKLAKRGLQDPEKLQKILDVSGPDGAKNIATKYFSQALDKDGNPNFEKMVSLYSKLPDKVKKMLLTPDQRNVLDKLATTHSFSNAAIVAAKNVPTGKLGALVSVAQNFLPALVGLGGAYGSTHGEHKELWATLSLLAMAPMARRVLLDNPNMLKRFAKSAQKPTTENAQKYTRGNAAIINTINQQMGG